MNRETIKVMEFINSCAIQWLISCNVDTSSTEKVLAVPKITTLDAKWVWNLFPLGQVRIWVICVLRHLEERNICSQGLWELVTSLTNGMSFLPLFYWWAVSLHITCRFFWSVTFRQFVLTRVSYSRDKRSHHFVLRAWSRNRCYTFSRILFSFHGSCHGLKVNERENLRDVCLLTNLMISCEAVNFHLRASRTKAEIIKHSASIGLPIIP